MFDRLTQQPADKILALMQQFREDPRDNKVDLGVGVYRNAQGVTPVMRAVKAAEQRIWEAQETKAYTGLAGDPAYSAAMIALGLGDPVSVTQRDGPMPRSDGPGACTIRGRLAAR